MQKRLDRSNLEFFDDFTRLQVSFFEYLKERNVNTKSFMTPFCRFASQVKVDSNTSPTLQPVLPSFVINQLKLLYTTFIMIGSMQEVNITLKTRIEIRYNLESKDNEILFTVFDVALDEVVNSLYNDLFKRFVEFKRGSKV
jgi:hypothetical protein